jgi:hypothetical protein
LSNAACIEQFYAKISSEKTKFYDFVASSAAPTFSSETVTVLSAVQVLDSDISSPLLPPDYYRNRDLQPETMDPVEFNDAKESRSIYHYLSDQPKSSRRK